MTRHMFALTALLFVTALLVSPAAADLDPCDDVPGSPDPHIRPPEPLIGGTVIDANSDAGVQGATLGIYRCVSGDATFVQWVTTNEDGDYLSGALTPGYYHYIEALLGGPLEGKSPTDNCSNPSAAIGLGDSALDVAFYFELPSVRPGLPSTVTGAALLLSPLRPLGERGGP